MHHNINSCFQSSSIIGAQKIDIKKNKSPKSICEGKSFAFIQDSTYGFFNLLAVTADFIC